MSIRPGLAAIVVVFAFLSMNVSRGLAENPPTAEIVGPLPNRKPVNSRDPNPSSRALIETSLAGFEWGPGKRFDQERYEIIDRRVVQTPKRRAFLQFRLLPLNGGTTLSAPPRCPSRVRPIEIQAYFEWSQDMNAWVALARKGDPGFKDCPSNDKQWTRDEIAIIVNPPPLAVPPEIREADVTTPNPDSPERKLILDAVRPRYEALFGTPIVFRVDDMRVASGFAYMVVHPQRPNGSPIERQAWSRSIKGCWQERESVTHQYWMKSVDGVWHVGWQNSFCADNSISDDGDLIGAPPQLIGRDRWPERSFLPIEDPQYFEIFRKL